MFASKSKFFAYCSVFFLFTLNFYPLTATQAKTINLGISTDIVSIPGTLLNGRLAGTGNRCLYVDASGNVSVKGFDCGSATGGDNLGDHSATQNLRLNTYWLSGDAGNEGVYVNSVGGVGINTSSIAAGLSLLVSGNLQSTGSVTLSGPIYAGGGNRMITVDNTGVLGAAAIPVDTNTDIYWTGTSTNLVAATGRTSLGLGALATLSAVSGGTAGTITDATITDADVNASAAISASKIQYGTYFIDSVGTNGQIWTADGTGAGAWAAPGASTDVFWTGTATNLVAATGRTSLGLGALATLNTVGNAQITDVAWSKITGFPAACSAGQYVTTVGGTLTCATPTDTNTDIYWTGTATNLVAATGRTSLGLGALATLSAVAGGTTGTITDGTITDADVSAIAAISASKIQNGTYFISSAGTSGQVWKSDGIGDGVWGTDAVGAAGSGTIKYLSKWTAADTLGDSLISDDGTNLGISTINPGAKLDINGSLRTNASVTFSSLASGAHETRVVTVDDTGTLGATSTTLLPSGTQNQTLRNNGLAWAADSNLFNTGLVVGINFQPTTLCESTTKLIVDGTVVSDKIHLTQPSNTQCYGYADLAYNSGTGYLDVTGTANGMNVTGKVKSSTGFASGLSTGLSGTVAVRNSTNTGSCNLVFTGGILTSETCP